MIRKKLSRKHITIVTLSTFALALVLLGLSAWLRDQPTELQQPLSIDQARDKSVLKDAVKSEQLSDEQANSNATGTTQEHGTVAEQPRASLGSLATTLSGSTLQYSTPVTNGKDGAACNLLLVGANAARIESNSTVKDGVCAGSVQNASLTAGSTWTATVTYQDTLEKLTKKQLITL